MAQELENRLEKLKCFLNKLEDFIKYKLMWDWVEPIKVVAIQKPMYDELSESYHIYGLLRVEKKYLPLEIRVGRKMVLIRAKPFIWKIPWEELEKMVNDYDQSCNI